MDLGKALKLALAGSVLAFAGASYASTCGTGLNTSNMTINGGEADNCYGPFDAGSSDLTVMQNYLNTNNVFGGGWTGVAKDDAGGGGTNGSLFSGIQFSLSAGTGTSGTFILSLTDTNGSAPLNLPATFDLIGVLNGGNVDAAYFFDNLTLNTGNNGTYTIAFTNNGGNNPNLSHIDILVRDGRTPTTVPEPGPLSLLGIGLLGAALARRRNKRA